MLYSVHAPEVECISRGKAYRRYEFGVKVSIAVTNRSSFAEQVHHILQCLLRPLISLILRLPRPSDINDVNSQNL